MLAALLIAAVAALFAALALAAGLAASDVTAADGSHLRARAAATSALDEALHLLVWRVLPPDGSVLLLAPAGTSGTIPVSVEIQRRSGAEYGHPEVADPVVRLSSAAQTGRARASASTVVALCPAAMPLGLSVAEDGDAQAPLSIEACGAYIGGALRGRDQVTIAAPPGVPLVPDGTGAPQPPDLVHGDIWPIAAVHTGGGIFPASGPADTEGAADGAWNIAALVDVPGAAWIAAAKAHALSLGGALTGAALRLDLLPASFPTGEPGAVDAAGRAEPAEGFVVVVDARHIDGGLTIAGGRDPLAAPVTPTLMPPMSDLCRISGEAIFITTG